MWNTPRGIRTLQGAEAKLFAVGLETLLQRRATWPNASDADRTGVPYFDSLTYGQKISTLLVVCRGLLREDVPEVECTAATDAAIYAVFDTLGKIVLLGNVRQMIDAAAEEAGIEDPCLVDSVDAEQWQDDIA